MTRPHVLTKPTVAAVVINYNYARFLPDALESVLGQTDPFDEILAVDDGSTDESPDVLARYAERVTVLRIPNGGQLGACLAGLERSSSDYVYFLDADDQAELDLVATLRPHLADRPVKVQFQLRGVSSEPHDLHSVFPGFPAHYDAARMREDNDALGFYTCPPTSGNVYLRSTLLALPTDLLDRRDFIDGPATLALPYRGEIRSVSAPLARYRLHLSNHSQWSEPTPELLTHEIDWFRRRWEETRALLGDDAPPVPVNPVYVLERDVMRSALEGGARVIGPAIRLVKALPATHLPVQHKILLAGWALMVSLPVRRWQRALVRARRSPLNRSGAVRRILAVILNPRRIRSTMKGNA